MSTYDPADTAAKRAALIAAIDDALPISGGDVRKRLKQLRKALDAAAVANKPCAECGHKPEWHREAGCAGDLLHCRCPGWDPGPEHAADHHARLAAGTEWVCQGCGYHNNGGICTHCGRLAAGTEEG